MHDLGGWRACGMLGACSFGSTEVFQWLGLLGALADSKVSSVGLIFHVLFALVGLGGAAQRPFSRATILVVRVPSVHLSHGVILTPLTVGLLHRNNTGGSIEKISNVGRRETVGLEQFWKEEA